MLKHIAKRFYINDQIVIALIKKLLPDKVKGEGFANTLINVVKKYDQSQEKVERNDFERKEKVLL